MNEVKRPRKPLIFYYGIALLIIILFNSIVMPWLAGQKIKEVDYGTFITMTLEKNIGLVEISDTENQIIFTDKEEKQIYSTAMVDDPERTQRLYEAGAQFKGEVIEEPNFLLSRCSGTTWPALEAAPGDGPFPIQGESRVDSISFSH